MSTTLLLEGVSKRYGRTQAVREVTLSVEPSVTALLGPNGAGKTTIMRVAATILAPDSGRVTTLGGDPRVAADRVAIRRRLGYLPQQPGFYRHFTAFDFVDYVAVLKDLTDRHARHDEVRRVLDLVGLADVANQRVKALSGGMRHRLALAQALLGAPELLVLDEPTAGLDPEQRLRFREVVSTLKQQPTILLSTHQTDDVSALCQRVVVLLEGRVRFDGSPSALTAQADGRVWVDDAQHPAAVLSWRTGEGLYRHIGDPPGGCETVAPTVDDAYLLLAGSSARQDAR